MTERFNSTDEIVGQFLPKVYTRRITLEGKGSTTSRPGTLLETTFSAAEQTVITVDYHIKDLLGPDGLGVITNNQNPDEDPNQIQDQILSALKVGIFLFNDINVYERFFRVITSFTARGAEERPIYATFEQYFKSFIAFNGGAEYHINDARPAELPFSVRNSAYQEYDQDNNLINIIPYSHTFTVNTHEFRNCENLSLVCFTYFDFESLSLDELPQNVAKSLGYITGELSADAITRRGAVQSTATVYRDAITRTPYYGPIHVMDGVVMSGLVHRGSSRTLVATEVPLTKIQDFRPMQRFQETNYQPEALQTFDSSIPSLDLVEKNNKDFFRVDDIIVDFDRVDRVANIEFTIDMSSVFRHTRYYDLIKSNPSAFSPRMLNLLEVTVLRRRVTDRPIGHNRVSSYSRIPFDQVEEETHIVATSGENIFSGNRSVITKEDRDSLIREISPSADAVRRTFFVEDRQVREFLGTGATFQYGVEIRVKDPTKDMFMNLLQISRNYLQKLHVYLQDASIPVFDTRMISRTDSSVPLGIGSDVPQYAETVQQGNYDTVNKKLTTLFAQHYREDQSRPLQLRRYPDLMQCVRNYTALIDFAFAKSEATLYRFSNPVAGNSGERGPNDGYFAPSPMDLLKRASGVSGQNLYRALHNMIKISNARPETIQSFIKTYEDLVMDLEDFFGISPEYSVSNEGAGYRGRGDNTLHMQRWFSSVEGDLHSQEVDEDGNPRAPAVESDNFITMDALSRVFFRYWSDDDLLRGQGIPSVSMEVFQRRVNLERDRYGVGEVNRLTPMSIVIGEDEVFFNEEDMQKEKRARESRKKREEQTANKLHNQYKERKRLGLQPGKKPHRRPLPMYRSVLGRPDLGKQVSNFVEELNSYEERHGKGSSNFFIGALNNATHYGENSPPSYDRYFNMMGSLIEEMTDGAFLYANSIDALERANKVLGDGNIKEHVASNIICGFRDNPPSDDDTETTIDSGEFDRDQLEYPGIINEIVQVPRQEVPRLPQTLSSNFPVGDIFLESGREFDEPRPTVPNLPPPPRPVSSRNPGPQPRSSRHRTRVSAGTGAVRVQKRSREDSAPTPSSRTRLAGPIERAQQRAAARSRTPSAPRATSSSVSLATPNTGTPAFRRVSAAPASTRGTSTMRRTSSGPTTGGYGY